MSNRLNDANREVIQRYVDAGGEGVVLSDLQTTLLTRWRRVDELIRESFFGKFKRREDIAKVMMSECDISRDTAYRDIVNAEHVFSSSAPLNKKYFIQRRIEFICDVIAKLTKSVTAADGKVILEIDPDNAEIAARWEAVLQKYIQAYPDYVPARSPKTIIFNIQNNLLVTTLTPETAMQEADMIIEQIEKEENG